MTSDLPGEMPSTIIAPDLSLSTVDTEIEIEKSLPWTPARISRPVDLVSPGATTIASGQSAVLSHGNKAPLYPTRPRNPSPPSLLGGDTFTPRLHSRQKDDNWHKSFLPELNEGDGIVQVGRGLGVCVDEFGTFFPEQESHQVTNGSDSVSDSSSGGSPQISLRDALALPIPLLVTPRASEIELRAVHGPGTPSRTPRLPARLLRWRANSNSPSPSARAARDVAAADALCEQEQGLPEISWHGLDADPFRCSLDPSFPTELREEDDMGKSGERREAVLVSSRRMDTTFRWSNASAEMGVPPHAPGHEHERAQVVSFATLSALTRRMREQGRALLRKSRSNMLFQRTARLSGSSTETSSPLPAPLGSIAAALEGGGLGSVRRIGLGIGYSLPNPGSTATPAQRVHGAFTSPSREGTVPAGCYVGLGGGRREKKRAAPAPVSQPPGGHERDRLEVAGVATSADKDGRLASGALPCDLGGVLILGNPGFGGAVAAPAATSNAD